MSGQKIKLDSLSFAGSVALGFSPSVPRTTVGAVEHLDDLMCHGGLFPMIDPLHDALVKLEKVLKEHVPELHGSLAVGADASELRRLALSFGSKDSLPFEISAWFAWRNGQMSEVSFLPKTSDWYLLSISEALFERAALQKGLAEYGLSTNWLPIAANSIGHIYMYEPRFDVAGSIYLFDRKEEWSTELPLFRGVAHFADYIRCQWELEVTPGVVGLTEQI